MQNQDKNGRNNQKKALLESESGTQMRQPRQIFAVFR